jgi:hypothetical protein
MMLRAAAFLIVVAALAQPIISSRRFGAIGARDVIFVLDNSMSTSRKIGNETVFDMEMAELSRLVGKLNGSDRLRILLVSPRPTWLSSGPIAGDSLAATSLLTQIREARPTEAAAEMFECIQKAITARPAGQDFNRFVTVITDGQAYGWHAETPALWTPIRNLAAKAAPPVLITIVPVRSAHPISNLSLDKITVDRAVLGIGQPATLTAIVKNNGFGPSAPSSVSWRAGDTRLGASTIPSLEPGAGTSVRISQPFATAGLIKISCQLGASDDLSADDTATVLLDVTAAVNVLLVEGERRTDPVQSETQCFLAAVGSEHGTNKPAGSAFQPTLIDYHQLASQDLSAFQCIVLADVPQIVPEGVRKLEQFVKSGGGLWIALGDQIHANAFNGSFFQGAGLSPVNLLEPSGDEKNSTNFVALAPPAAEHPATALLADLQRLDIDRVKIYRRHQFGSNSGSPLSVLLRAEGGASLAVEKTLGRGRIIVQAFPLGLAWSNLPLCQSFVVMVHEWLWYLAEPSLVKRNLKAGELLEISRNLSNSDSLASLETPDGGRAQLIGLEQDGRYMFRYHKTQVAGGYTLNIAGSPPGSQSESFFVSRDPQESNLTPLSADQMEGLSRVAGFSFGPENFHVPAGNRVIAQPKPVAFWFLLALLSLLIFESIFVFFMARRRAVKYPAIMPEPAINA